MPFAQWHYPFENKERFDANFPAQFIGEAIDHLAALTGSGLDDERHLQERLVTGLATTLDTARRTGGTDLSVADIARVNEASCCAVRSRSGLGVAYLQLRTDHRAHEPRPGTLRRHAHHQGRQRLPVPD